MARRKSVSKATKKAAVVAAVQESREYIPDLGSLEPRTVLPLATRDEAIRALMNSLNKEDKKVIVYADEAPNTYIIRRPTGIMELDVDIGGGFPAGGCCMISGPDNCLAGDTLIHHEVHKDGKRVTHKWITLERLFQRFHGIKVPGKGKSQRKSPTKDTGTYLVPSMNDDLGILQNQVLDVVCTGEKECFRLETVHGFSIVGTAEHRFFDGQGFVTMGSLKPGSIVYVHDNTRREAPLEKEPTQKRKLLYLKWHPAAPLKDVRDRKTGKTGKTYQYHVLPRSRAVVEAAMNGLGLDTYVKLLNDQASVDSWQRRTDRLKFLPNSHLVHHMNENTMDDRMENLVVYTRANHMLEHLRDPKRDNYFRFMAHPDCVKSIKYEGRLVTYDLKMADPYRNYVAGNFVVHNSGKTRLLLETMAMQQRLYGDECRIALAITEGGFPFDQARDAKLKVCLPDSMILQYQRLRMERRLPLLTDEEVNTAYKQRVGQVVVIRGETGEEILGYVLKAIATRAFSFIGVDSINGLLPTADAAKDLVKNPKKAAHAFLIDNFFKHYISPMTTGVTGTNETTLVFTQQVRANQERANAPAHLQQYIKPWAVSGAYAAKHFKLIDLTVSDGKVLRQKSDQEGERGPVIGKMVNWMLEKGKAGTHDNKSGEVAYYYGINRFDIAGEIIVSGMRRGVIQQVGRKWCVCRPATGEVLPDLTAPSQKALRSMIEADFEFELAVRREILASAGIECLYR